MIWYVFSPKGFGGHGTAVWAVISWPMVLLLVVFFSRTVGPWFCVWPAIVSALLGIFFVMRGIVERSIWAALEGLFALLSGVALVFLGRVAWALAHM